MNGRVAGGADRTEVPSMRATNIDEHSVDAPEIVKGSLLKRALLVAFTFCLALLLAFAPENCVKILACTLLAIFLFDVLDVVSRRRRGKRLRADGTGLELLYWTLVADSADICERLGRIGRLLTGGPLLNFSSVVNLVAGVWRSLGNAIQWLLKWKLERDRLMLETEKQMENSTVRQKVLQEQNQLLQQHQKNESEMRKELREEKQLRDKKEKEMALRCERAEKKQEDLEKQRQQDMQRLERMLRAQQSSHIAIEDNGMRGGGGRGEQQEWTQFGRSANLYFESID